MKGHCWFPVWAQAIWRLLLLAALPAGTLHAQRPPTGLARHADTIFAHIGKREGLPNSAAASIVQDADGFLWFGSGSVVSRWDGYHFKSYVMKVGVPDALPDNDVWTLYVDPQKRLWIGTATRGLVRYDPAYDNFHTYRPPGEASYKTIHAIATDGKKGLWVLSGKGLDHFDPDTGAFTHVDMPGIGPKQNMYDLCHDVAGRIVLATIKGLYRGDAEGKQFASWDVFDGPPPRVIGLFLDDGGRIWIGTPRGVYLIPAGGDKATLVQENGEDGKALSGNPLAGQGVQAFTQISPGVMWVGTVGNGILQVDTKTLAMRRITHDPVFETSLLDDSVLAFFRDHEGTLWTATQNGVSQLLSRNNGISTLFGDTPGNDAKSSVPQRPVQDEVNAILARQDGSVVLGLGLKGFEIIDATGRKTALVEPHAMQPASVLPMGIVHGLAESPDGTLFLGTAAGVYRADHDGSHVALIPAGPTPLALVYQLIYDAGTLWIATDTGVWKQDISGKTPAPAVSLPVPSVTSQAIARRGDDLWIGTTSDLYRYDVKAGMVEKISLGSQSGDAGNAAIFSLALDGQQRLWIATNGGGLMVLTGRDANGKPQFRSVLQGNIDTIRAGADGLMWASTDNGLARIDPKTWEVLTIQEADGAPISSYYSNSSGVFANGSLVFGGAGGLTLLEPSLVKPWIFLPPVVVTEVTVGGKRVPSSGFNLQNAGPIVVAHDKNSLDVEFAALDYSASELNKYQYRMVGFDPSWVQGDATHRVASYTNLPPGNYTLELRGSNRSGVWSPSRTIAVHVLPAWWQTWWARVLLVVLVIVLLFELLYLYTAILRRRQKVLEHKVALRTFELQEATLKIEESHRQMEKIAYTDSLTGLSNRRLFNNHFRNLLAKKQSESSAFVLLLIDLDKFKQINDTYGHDAGDAWLIEVSSRIRQQIGADDCFARLGGDEFGILLEHLLTDTALETFCAEIAALFLEPVNVAGGAILTTLSIGVATFPADGAEQEPLYKAADLALYSVKRTGGNSWRRFSPDLLGNRIQGESPTRRSSD